MVMAKQDFNIGLSDIISGGSWDGCACHSESRDFIKLYALFEKAFNDNVES